jgi:hypothetical protein
MKKKQPESGKKKKEGEVDSLPFPHSFFLDRKPIETRGINARIPLWFAERLQTYCDGMGITKSNLLKEALSQYLVRAGAIKPEELR